MKKAELVFVPMPGMGHLVSTVELAKLLVDLNSNLSITVLIIKTPYDPNLTAYIDSLIADTVTISTRIKFINLPQDEAQKGIPPNKFMTTIIQIQRPHIKEAIAKIVQYSNSVPNSPRLVGAAFLGFQFYMQAFRDEQNVDITKLKGSDAEFTIPSYVNPIAAKFFPPLMFKLETLIVLLDVARELREVKGIMVNSFLELESHAVDSFSNGEYPAVFPVGPILNLKSESRVHQNSNIMKWLDEQPLSSVVFLCFGSMGSFGGDQVKEIARALEQSGHRFLWSLRQPPVEVMMLSSTDYENVEEDSDVRNRAKEMSKQSRKALMEGGSSHSTLCRFIDDHTGMLGIGANVSLLGAGLMSLLAVWV
ncbi:hypothetical protein QQP08_003859 [Theobroma cacao]|nr:hypothetical protein QQP08_003859 [Theobroma cacao]